MGYDTSFKGELKFTRGMAPHLLIDLKKFLGADCRDHPEWVQLGHKDLSLSYIDLELLDDYSGLRWNDAEKTHDMVKAINVIILNLRHWWSDFGLTGELIAQGEDPDDKWKIVIENGLACRKEIPVLGDTIVCPHCNKEIDLKCHTN